MKLFLDVLTDALIDTAKMLPFLFGVLPKALFLFPKAASDNARKQSAESRSIRNKCFSISCPKLPRRTSAFPLQDYP